MSLVGTRPPTVDEWEQYELHHRSRMSTKPGITGMWQVSGRSDITDFEEVVRLDTEYIENWTIDHMKKNNRYYKYRVARSYKEYYDTFAQKYSQEDKIIFLKRCQEMYYDLKNYKKGLNEDEIRKDVKECENALKYIFDNENIVLS